MSTPSNNYYAPPQSVIADVAGAATFEKATRASRLGATILDGLIFSAPFTLSYVAIAGTLPHAGIYNPVTVWGMMASTGGAFYLGALIDLVLIAVTTVLVYRNAQTIGKRLLGIKVARTDGSRASLARIFWLRYLLNTVISMVPLLGGLYVIVDILMIFGEQRRCCHDYIADTIVIRA
jgi:uncharacterized RDD family membrane protein YckC